jgi:hypothetical protein
VWPSSHVHRSNDGFSAGIVACIRCIRVALASFDATKTANRARLSTMDRNATLRESCVMPLRQAGTRRAIASARDDAGKERGYFAGPNNAAAFFATREANGADVEYCWKSLTAPGESACRSSASSGESRWCGIAPLSCVRPRTRVRPSVGPSTGSSGDPVQ